VHKIETLPETLEATAHLVNVSRARNMEWSGDWLARHWIPEHLRAETDALYDRYMAQVYAEDDKIVSARTRYYQRVIDNLPDGSSVVLAPVGLTSYPFLCKKRHAFTEFELPGVIAHRKQRAQALLEAGIIPDCDVEMRALDLRTVDEKTDLEAWFRGTQTRCIILEGLSYYLTRQDWWRLLNHLLQAMRPGDQLAFDFWPQERAGNPVYQHYRDFCEREAGFENVEFTFLSRNEIDNQLAHRPIKQQDIQDCAALFRAGIGDVLPDKDKVLLDTITWFEFA